MGKAILREVASRAAASVRIHIEMNAITKAKLGLNSAESSSKGARLDMSPGGDERALLFGGRVGEGFSSTSDSAMLDNCCRNYRYCL